jgi:pimeloyl-ACP methyl ester carboxylesterase
VASIAAARVAYEEGDLRARLARHHDDVDGAFRGWNDVWLRPEFRTWNIEEYLPRITVPVLAIQGEDDQYGTMDQVDRIARGAVGARVEVRKLAGCGHLPQRDRPAEVLAAITRFVSRL